MFRNKDIFSHKKILVILITKQVILNHQTNNAKFWKF